MTTPTVEALTTASLALALDAASLRQQVHAANLANHGAAGHVPQRVVFESLLEDARRGLQAGVRLDAAVLDQARPIVEPADYPAADGRPQPLDAEVAALSHNATHYQVLARALGRHLGLLALAAGDGRR